MAQLILPGTAAPGDVLTGKNFSGGTNYGAAGTMPNNGAVNRTPNNASQSIPAGYTTGGTVSAVTFTAGNVLTGTTIAGTAGTMPNRAATNFTPSNAAQTVPAGYHNGSGSVAAVTVPAGNVLTGTTIAGTAGTMPNNGAPTWTPNTGNQGLAAGYYSGGTVQGSGNLTAGNIANGVNIFGVIGNLAPRQFASGSAVSSAGTSVYTTSSASTLAMCSLVVSGLTFTPTLILAYSGANMAGVLYRAGASLGFQATSPIQTWLNAAPQYFTSAAPAAVSASGFTLPVPQGVASTSFTWVAFA